MSEQTSTLAAIKSALTNLMRTFSSDVTSPSVTFVIILSFVATLVSTVLAIVYFLSVLGRYSLDEYRVNPINKESMDYVVARSHSIFGEYKYITFVFFAIIQFVPLVVIVVMLLRGSNMKVNSEIPKLFMMVLIVQGLLALVFNTMIFYKTYKTLKLVSRRIQEYNTYVFKRIYKNREFLSVLSQYAQNPFEIWSAVKQALTKVHFDTLSPKDISKVFFTINLFLNLKKMGMRNTNLPLAMRQFQPLNMLSPRFFRMSDFLLRNSSYMDDYTGLIVQPKSTLLPGEAKEHMQKIMGSMSTVSQWVSTANLLANSFFPQDAFYPFMKMSIGILLVQLLPFIFIWVLLKSPERRKELLAMFSKIQNEPTPNVNIPRYPKL